MNRFFAISGDALGKLVARQHCSALCRGYQFFSNAGNVRRKFADFSKAYRPFRLFCTVRVLFRNLPSDVPSIPSRNDATRNRISCHDVSLIPLSLSPSFPLYPPLTLFVVSLAACIEFAPDIFHRALEQPQGLPFEYLGLEHAGFHSKLGQCLLRFCLRLLSFPPGVPFTALLLSLKREPPRKLLACCIIYRERK